MSYFDLQILVNTKAVWNILDLYFPENKQTKKIPDLSRFSSFMVTLDVFGLLL